MCICVWRIFVCDELMMTVVVQRCDDGTYLRVLGDHDVGPSLDEVTCVLTRGSTEGPPFWFGLAGLVWHYSTHITYLSTLDRLPALATPPPRSSTLRGCVIFINISGYWMVWLRNILSSVWCDNVISWWRSFLLTWFLDGVTFFLFVCFLGPFVNVFSWDRPCDNVGLTTCFLDGDIAP